MRAAVLVFTLLLCGSALATLVSQNYPCIQGHEQTATTKLQTYVKQAVVDFFRNRRIAINPGTLQLNFSNSTQRSDGPPYVSFAGGAGAAGGSSGLGASSVAATVAAQDGTKFNVLLSSGSDNQDAAEYRIVSAQRGFDREGNAIRRHCSLKLFNSGDGEATESLLVVNASSGHVLGRIRLPAAIPVY